MSEEATIINFHECDDECEANRAIAARAREELEELDKCVSLDPRADTFEAERMRRWLKRIIGEEAHND